MNDQIPDVKKIIKSKKIKYHRGRPPIDPNTPFQDRKVDYYLTAGEIFRHQLMLSTRCTPMKSRMKVNVMVKNLASYEVETPWGMSKAISIKQLNDYNELILRTYNSKIALNDFIENGLRTYHTAAKLVSDQKLST